MILLSGVVASCASNVSTETATMTTDKQETEPVIFIRAAHKPPMVTAEEWGSEPDEFPAEYIHTPKAIIIHHTGVVWKEGQDPKKSVKNLQTWGAAEKGWHDVPYHFMIAPDGTILEGRSLKYRPDTNTEFDTTGYINVEVMGNFEEQRVSAAQLQSAALICAWLSDEYNMNPQEIKGHKDVSAITVCPGKDLFRYMHEGPFEEWVEIARLGKLPAVELLAPMPDGPTAMIPGAADAK